MANIPFEVFRFNLVDGVLNIDRILNQMRDSGIEFSVTLENKKFIIELFDNDGIVIDSEKFDRFEEAILWLIEKVVEHFPESEFVKFYTE